MDAATGEQWWESETVTGLNNGARIRLAPNGGSVLLYTDQGELVRARLTPQRYEESSRTALLTPTDERNASVAPTSESGSPTTQGGAGCRPCCCITSQ